MITETDEIVINDRYYAFSFTEDVSTPFEDRTRTTVYRRSNAAGTESVSVEEGAQRVHELLSKLQAQREQTASNTQ